MKEKTSDVLDANLLIRTSSCLSFFWLGIALARKDTRANGTGGNASWSGGVLAPFYRMHNSCRDLSPSSIMWKQEEKVIAFSSSPSVCVISYSICLERSTTVFILFFSLFLTLHFRYLNRRRSRKGKPTTTTTTTVHHPYVVICGCIQ